MPPRIYTIVTASIFLALFVAHLLRLLYGWPAQFNGWDVPMWVSWVAMIVAAYLSAVGFRNAQGK